MKQLPKTLDPIKLAKLNAQLSGNLPLALCPRLQEIFDQKNHEAIVDLQFSYDNALRVYVIQGKVKAVLNLICQRCNEPMQYSMDSSISLSPVVSEERAKNLPEAVEPVFMKDELISVHEMIEDEILLLLPMVPKHEACALPQTDNG